MDKKTLVTYASKHGSTAGIAEKIGEMLRHKGLQTDVLDVGSVHNLTPYNNIILGSSVYIGLWHKKAVRFLRKNSEQLAGMAVWIFICGPTGSGNPLDLTNGWLYPKSLEPVIEQIKPRSVTCFGGKLVLQTLNPIEKWMINKVKAPEGDFRNWQAIASWVETIRNAAI